MLIKSTKMKFLPIIMLPNANTLTVKLVNGDLFSSKCFCAEIRELFT